MSTIERADIYAMRANWSDSIDLAFIARGFASERSFAMPVTMRRIERDGERIDPFLSLTNQQAQQLMDELWRAGVRPAEGMGSIGQLAAVNRHLEDMRMLVFKPGAK